MVQKNFKVGALDTANIALSANGFTTSLQADPTLRANVSFSLPSTIGSNSQVLTTDGSGNLFFSDSSANTNIYVGNTLLSNTSIILEAGSGISLTTNSTSKTINISTAMSNVTSQIIEVDGSTNSFQLVKAVANSHMVLVSYNGLLQEPGQYSIDSTTITMANSKPLLADSIVEVRYFDFFENTGSASSATSALASITDPFFNNVSLLLDFEDGVGSSEVTDYSTAQNTITKEVNATITDEIAHFGSTSAKFIYNTNGAVKTGNVVAGDPLDLSTGRPDFTIEAWIRPTAFNTATNEFVNVITAYGPQGYGAGYSPLSFHISPSNQKLVLSYNVASNGVGSAGISSESTLSLNTWQHVAATRSGNTVRLFINGVLEGSTTFTGTPYTPATNVWTIGQGTNGTYDYVGYIDELRITKGIARYTSTFSVPTASFPKDYMELRDLATLSINDFSDVDTTAPPSEGQALLWDSASSTWQPGDVDMTTAIIQKSFAMSLLFRG